MAEQTIVAVYDTAAHADAAVQALRAANVPANAISQHAAAGTGQPPAQEKGFWSSLFGGDSSDDDAFSRSVAGGSTVVTVKVPEQQAQRTIDILEAHSPIDFDERAASYGAVQATAAPIAAQTTPAPIAAAPVAPPKATAPVAAVPARPAAPIAAPATGMAGDDTIKVVEERLTVGKRAVNRGGARVRAYVVETPIEERVTLRDETLHVERRPVTDGQVVTDADFRERTIEMTEVDEEAVVSKEARVVEEIALRKDVSERVETVRDTVRRTEVDVEDTTTRTGTSASVTGSMGTTGSNPPGTAASRAVDKTLGTNVSGGNPAGGAPDGAPSNPPGTAASRAVDKTLGTNVSGANPAGGAPDGAPGNPPGTAASRAVDKTLGTNVSGANPARK